MQTWKKAGRAAIACVIAVGIAQSISPAGEKAIIRVGTKDFTESLIVGELYSLALEDAGYGVERVFNIAGSVVHTSIVNNQIDLYPEYTGTGLLTVLKMELMTDPVLVYETVKREYERRFNLVWLDQSRANDSQGLVMRTSVAREHGIVTISDLQQKADRIRFASQGEFDLRDDGLPGLTKVYGPFRWKSSRVYDNGLKYHVLLNDQADLAPAYTTEGRLANTRDFTLLQDDKQMWPPYFLAPVVRGGVLGEYPDLAPVLNRVSASLDTGIMIRLNAEVDLEQREVEDVAKEYFSTIGPQTWNAGQ